MKNNILFLLLVLLIWIFGGVWLYHKCCCSGGNTGTAISTVTASTNQLEIKDQLYFEASAESNVAFEDQKTTYTMSEEVKSVFAQTAGYLNQHPAKILQITTPSVDLEQQRGDAVAAYLVAENKVTKNQVLVSPTTAKQLEYSFNCLKPFTANAGSTNFSCFDNFAFEQSKFDLAVPLSGELDALLKNVAKHLKEHPTTNLDLIASYAASEENNSSSADLGKARANKIRSLLLEKYGVDPKQVTYRGLQKDNLSFLPYQQFENDLLLGPVDFVFTNQANNDSNTEATATRLQSLEKDILVTPRRLYFDTGKNRIIIDAKFRKYFEDLIFYLENVPTARLECSGHTDSKGNDANNLELAQKRADFAALYLSKQGISTNKISAISLGEKQPIESNTTASGRAKNRRVDIIVKK